MYCQCIVHILQESSGLQQVKSKPKKWVDEDAGLKFRMEERWEYDNKEALSQRR